MNVFHKFAVAALFAAPFLLTSCSDDEEDAVIVTITPTLQNIEYDDDIWDDWDENINLNILGFNFSHTYVDLYNYSEGFVAAKSSDTGFHTPMYEHQFTVISGGGPAGEGTPYLVANWNSSETAQTTFKERSCSISYPNNDGSFHVFTPVSIDVNNTCYAYYSMTQGDDFAKKFEEGDYFVLEAHGLLDPQGLNERTVEINLAKCDANIPADQWIINNWTTIDLSSLGDVYGIYFTMRSSDSGTWGMNTPAYFALSNFRISTTF